MKLAAIIFGALILIGAIVLLVNLIGGAIGLISGAFNALLGIIVIVALLAIVAWMFLYARKRR